MIGGTGGLTRQSASVPESVGTLIAVMIVLFALVSGATVSRRSNKRVLRDRASQARWALCRSRASNSIGIRWKRSPGRVSYGVTAEQASRIDEQRRPTPTEG